MKNKPDTIKVFTFLQLQELLLEFQNLIKDDYRAYTPGKFLSYINTPQEKDAIEAIVDAMDDTPNFDKASFLKNYKAHKKKYSAKPSA